MSLKRVTVAGAFILPAVVLIGLAAYRNKHPAANAYSQNSFSATSNQVAKTLNDWNSIDAESFLDISDRPKVKAKLHGLFQAFNLTELQMQAGEACSLDLLESLSTGNYEQFIQARIPAEGYEIPEAVVKGLQHYSGLPAAAAPLDHYREIWRSTFKTNSLWTQILFNQTNAIILRTNSSVLKDRLDFPPFPGAKGNAYVQSYTTLGFNYQNLQQKELETNKSLLIWSLFFMAKEPQLNQSRPFMISFFWSANEGIWIPVDFVHGFIKNPVLKHRFF